MEVILRCHSPVIQKFGSNQNYIEKLNVNLMCPVAVFNFNNRNVVFIVPFDGTNRMDVVNL